VLAIQVLAGEIGRALDRGKRLTSGIGDGLGVLAARDGRGGSLAGIGARRVGARVRRNRSAE
jgi:hypothetical protein